MSPAWSGSPDRCENMSPTVTICATSGFDNANHGSLDTTDVSQPIALTPTCFATTVALSGLDSDANWNTVSGSTRFFWSSAALTSLTPKPLAYTVFSPCTTATAIPGMPDFFIKSATIPSSLATALSMALSGSAIAGTNGGGISDSVCAVGGGAGSAGLALQPETSASTSTPTVALATAFMR